MLGKAYTPAVPFAFCLEFHLSMNSVWLVQARKVIGQYVLMFLHYPIPCLSLQRIWTSMDEKLAVIFLIIR